MIFLIICFCLLGYAIYLHDIGERDKSTFIFFLFLCNGFGFFHSDWLNGMPINKYKDFALIYLLYDIVGKIYNSDRIIIKSFPIYRWLSFLVLYLTLEFIFTILTGKEIFSLSLAVYRDYLFFLSFILFQGMKKRQLRNVVVSVSLATMLSAVVYVTQPIFRLPILDRAPVAQVGEGTRYRNVPELLYFVLLYITVRLDLSKFKSILVILICILSLALTQHRGVMLGYAATVVLYLILSKDTRKALQYGIIGFVAFIAVGSMVVSRFENKGKNSTFDDISNVLNMDYSRAAANGYDDEGGTLAFRVLLFVERFDYFQRHPKYMLTGVGMRHEDSPKTQREFHFILGSRKRDRLTGFRIPQQIDSGDLVWFRPFVKFGIIGLVLYLYITWLIIVYLYKKRKNGTLATVTFLFYVLLIAISMKNDYLFAPIQVTFLLLIIELIRKNKANAIDRILFQEFKLLGKNGV